MFPFAYPIQLGKGYAFLKKGIPRQGLLYMDDQDSKSIAMGDTQKDTVKLDRWSGCHADRGTEIKLVNGDYGKYPV